MKTLWIAAFSLACSAEPGPQGPPGEPGPPGENGLPGPQGPSAADADGLGEIVGFVACSNTAMTGGGDNLITAFKTTFFSEGWTYNSATLITAEDDHSQSDFSPPGLDPSFVFAGAPVLSGLIVATMELQAQQMRWAQDGVEMVVRGWASASCEDSRP